MNRSEDWTSENVGWATWAALAIVAVCYLIRCAVQRLSPFWSTSSAASARRSNAISSSGSSASRISIQITDEDLLHFMEVLEEAGNEEEGSWELVLERQSDRVAYSAKRRDPKDGGATEYLSTTVFQDSSTRLLRDFYMDSDFRAKWDKTLVHHRQLDVCQVTGIEVGQMVKKFPLMMAREYVLAWRVWEGDDQSYYCFLKACDHPDAPRQPKYKRVEVYVSGWRIRRVAGRDACEVKMVHQEDMGMQRDMAKVAFRRGIWTYVLRMNLNLRQYGKPQLHPGLNAVSLAHKVPVTVKERFPSKEPVPEKVLHTSRQSSTSGLPLRNCPSKKKLAKGLLLLGGVVFFAQGSASLGAKIATVCMMNRAWRAGSPFSIFLQRVET